MFCLKDEKPRKKFGRLWDLINQHDEMPLMINRFRRSNIVRHNLVSWPLANYTIMKVITEENL